MKRIIILFAILSLSVASCDKIDNPNVEIIITKSAEDSDLPLLWSNSRNDVPSEFIPSPAGKGFRYDLVYDADVRLYVKFNDDSTSGTISIISNGDMVDELESKS